MIRNLGEVEALQAAEETGALEVVCDFCGQVYRYTPQEVVALFQTGDETQH
jgi:molecular chaperone Hsp33